MALTEASLFALLLLLSMAVSPGMNGNSSMELVPGCHRLNIYLKCRSWRGPDAPDFPDMPLWSDILVLDLSSAEVAKKIDVASRGNTCRNRQEAGRGAAERGLGASLPQGKLPARWLGVHFMRIIVLFLRGAGLRAVHRDAFELVVMLQHVYLSNNNIRNLDPDMWLHNKRLTGVSLENNWGFELPQEGPLFRSDSIENLDLSGCGLRELPADALRELPSLQTLRLERNCLTTVPAAALAPLDDLWSLTMAENMLTGLSATEAGLLAKIPESIFHGNPWRCDCGLRAALGAPPLQADEHLFWQQAMPDLVCHWPPEDVERSWEEVLRRDTCREYNESAENATNKWQTEAQPQTTHPSRPVPSAAAPAALIDATCRCDNESSFCKWSLALTLILTAALVAVCIVATFSGRLRVSVSLGILRSRRGPAPSISNANLVVGADDEHRDEADEDLEADTARHLQPWKVVRFGRGG